MENQAASDTIGFYVAGESNFPILDSVTHTAVATCDGPIAMITKKRFATLHVFHRNGKRYAKKELSGAEVVLGMHWYKGNTLVVITSKGLVYFFSVRCEDNFPKVRLSRTDLTHAFVTANFIIIQQDNSIVFVYAIESLLAGKLLPICVKVHATIHRAISQQRQYDTLLVLTSQNTLYIVVYRTEKSIIDSKQHTFSKAIEMLSISSDGERICIYINGRIQVFEASMLRSCATVSLEKLAFHPLDVTSLDDFHILISSLTQPDEFRVLVVKLQGRSVESFRIPMCKNERIVYVCSDIDMLRIYTTQKSYCVLRIENMAVEHTPSFILSKCFHLASIGTVGPIESLLNLIIPQGESRVDSAIKYWLESAQKSFDPEEQQAAYNIAYFGTRFTKTNWVPALLETQRVLCTLVLLRNAPLPMLLTVPQMKYLSIDGIVDRCISYRDFGIALTIAAIHSIMQNKINREWVVDVIAQYGLSDQDVLNTILPQMVYFDRSDFHRVILACKQSHRSNLLDYFMQEISKNVIYYPMLFQFYASTGNLLGGLRVATHVGDPDTMLLAMLAIDDTHSPFVLPQIPPNLKAIIHNLQKLWKNYSLWSTGLVSWSYKELLSSVLMKWGRFIKTLRFLPSHTWEVSTSSMIKEITSLGKRMLESPSDGKNYHMWITNAAILLTEQCNIAKSTGNIGFIGKTFHQTVVMCHSYQLKKPISTLAKHFEYSDYVKFWMFLLFLCEIRDWHSADALINEAYVKRQHQIGPGVTEVLYEHGRYAYSIQHQTNVSMGS